MITIPVRHWGNVMRDKRSNRRIPFAILTCTAVLLATSAWAQVMPLPIGPPMARTDSPSYGPAYPPPRLARAEPQSVPPSGKAKATPKGSVPAVKSKSELRRELERRPTDLRRDRADNRVVNRPTPSQRSATMPVHTSRPSERDLHRPTQAPRRQAQQSR